MTLLIKPKKKKKKKTQLLSPASFFFTDFNGDTGTISVFFADDNVVVVVIDFVGANRSIWFCTQVKKQLCH